MTDEDTVATDVLVIGGGIAGMFAAIKAREAGAEVTMVDKGYAGKSGASAYAGHFAVFNPDWGHDFDAWMDHVATIALWRSQQKYFNAANEYKGMKLLAAWVLAGNNIQGTGKPVRSVGGQSKAITGVSGEKAVRASVLPGTNSTKEISRC